METLTSSEGVSIESGSDTGPFEYTHEYSRDYGKTWRLYDGEMIEPDYLTLNSDGTIEKVSGAEDYKVFSCGFGASGYSPGGVSWIPPDAQQERKAKWRKRFHMKGRKNV